MKFAGVIVDISHEQLDKFFQYIIPDELISVVDIGSRVNIPFGRSKRTGYVVDISEEAEIELSRMKAIESVCEGSFNIDGKFIKLANWMKHHYGCTTYQALKAVLPVKEKVRPVEKKTLKLLVDEEEALRLAAEAERKKRFAQYRLLMQLAANPVADYSLVNQKLNISMQTVNSLVKAGVVAIDTFTAFRNEIKRKAEHTSPLALNEEQAAVAQSIIQDMSQGNQIPCLIKGITGSGKTEVYMSLIEWTLAQGKEVICLIPEISLTYQTVMRFYNRFGNQLSIINSRMSKGERYDSFLMAKESKIKIMVGPRSALFTPFQNLGLIIIDEEHEGAYKSDMVPKYHARETAIELARMSNAKVVLGSATPSLDSYYYAKEGIYKLYELTKRAGGGTLPHVQIVDLREEMRAGNRSVFSRELTRLVEEKLSRGEQVMLFLNRRGYQGFLNCRDCGAVVECPHCAVSLTEHRGGKLVCHYCGYETPAIKLCPKCGSKHIGKFKAGTEMIEEEAKRIFPQARTLRMDLDTTKGKDGHAKILEQFANYEADILIGTQMIVKGHDFHNVTLVGILLADVSLHSPDYMASERTFELLTQAAGRAGRGQKPGDVVIQTYDPEHYSIVHAGTHDYDGFYEEEIVFRKLMKYPPVVRMLVIKVFSEDEQLAIRISEQIREMIRPYEESARVIGPSNAAIYKINDQYQRVIYVKHGEHELLEAVVNTIDTYYKNNNVSSSKYQLQYDFG